MQQMIKQKGFTNYSLAKKAQIGQSTVCELVSGKRKEPRASTVIKISNALGIEIEKIYQAIKEG
nr:helix-turn-helix transcriptional regulator [Clostridium algidicarnis]